MSNVLAAATDIVSVLVAAAAFVVSVASLWFTSLRWPQVEVDSLEDTLQLRPALEWRRAMPLGCVVSLDVLVANTGAGGTVVQELRLANLSETSSGDEGLWVGATPATPAQCELMVVQIASAWDERHPDEPRPPYKLMTPTDEANAAPSGMESFVLEPRAIKALELGALLNPKSIPAEEFARRLHALRSAQLVLVWTFRRPKWPSMRRTPITKTDIIQLPTDSFKQECIHRWEWWENRDDLANIAKGRG